MFGLGDHQEVEHPDIKVRICIILEHMQEILGNAYIFLRMADMQRTPLHRVAVAVVGICDDCRHLCYQVDRLTDEVVARKVVRVRVEGIHLEYAARQDVHDVRTFEVDDADHGTMVKSHAFVDQHAERIKLLLVRQTAGKKKECRFLISETTSIHDRSHKVVKFISTVEQLSFHRFQGTVFLLLVSYDVSDIRKSYQHSRTVLVSEAPLDAVFLEQFIVYPAGGLHLVAQLINQIILNHTTRFSLTFLRIPLCLKPCRSP